MPPKQKFSEKDIVLTATSILRKEGLEGITARNLAAHLGTSSRPIFTVFNSMEEVQKAVIRHARDLYNERITEALTKEIPFKAVGLAYLKFAQEEPKLFQLLFMSEGVTDNYLTKIPPTLDENSHQILKSITDTVPVSEEIAHQIYVRLWIFTHGLATLGAPDVHHFSETETDKMLSDVFLGTLHQLTTQHETHAD